MANQGNQQPQFPEKEQLPQQIRQLITTLENLLAVRYPIMTNRIPIQARRNPILAEIAKVLIAYHVHTNNRAIAEDTTIYRWLRLTPADILTKEAALEKMHQPHILSAMCTHGIANFSVPSLSFKTENPILEHARNIVQGQLSVLKYSSLFSGMLAYHLRFDFGREGALCDLPTAALPFPEPTDITALHYNARGGNLFSFKANLQNTVQQYQPMIIIVTETRLGSGEANQMASRINYRQVLTIDPIGYSGGVWLFSNLANISLDRIMQTESEIRVNFLQI
ncbi:Endonuclease/exonuclease/phosphatase [Corchorus olitorius]|uniref:Endonuclease/exonuclease/phosphatase n=1 Tax=Corchorus olitorius TaxID=93759 RepID=A0A1R3KNC8_9ROSI|nr:Endonuclease/exonuclease/phosphatase [Corchorus olitorius]